MVKGNVRDVKEVEMQTTMNINDSSDIQKQMSIDYITNLNERSISFDHVEQERQYGVNFLDITSSNLQLSLMRILSIV